MKKFTPSAIALSVGLLIGVGFTPLANAYNSLTILGNGMALGINDTGLVVGSSNNLATLWNGANATTLSNTSSIARSINNSGQVAGSIGNQAILWNGTTPTVLGSLSGITNSYAMGINNSGQIVGYGWGSTGQAVGNLWNGTTPTSLSGTSTYVYGINNSGQVAGSIGNQAALWNGTTSTIIGSPGSAALAINDSGLTAGYISTYSWTAGSGQQATLWNGTTSTVLAGLGGIFTSAQGMNNSGLIVGVGRTINNINHGIMWSQVGGVWVATDLNTLIDPTLGFTISSAQAINNVGQIVGFGTNSLGVQSAFVMSVAAVPEPSTYALMLAGLGLLGFISYRRKSDV